MSCESCADARDGRPHRAGSEVLPVELRDLVLDRDRRRVHVAQQVRHREGDLRLARRRQRQSHFLGAAGHHVETLDETGLAAAGDGGVAGERDVDRCDAVDVAEDQGEVSDRVLHRRNRRVVVVAEQREVRRVVGHRLVDGECRPSRNCDERHRDGHCHQRLLDDSHEVHGVLLFFLDEGWLLVNDK